MAMIGRGSPPAPRGPRPPARPPGDPVRGCLSTLHRSDAEFAAERKGELISESSPDRDKDAADRGDCGEPAGGVSADSSGVGRAASDSEEPAELEVSHVELAVDDAARKTDCRYWPTSGAPDATAARRMDRNERSMLAR